MCEDAYQDEMRAIRLLQERSRQVEKSHKTLYTDIEFLKKQLSSLGSDDITGTADFTRLKNSYLDGMSCENSVQEFNIDYIYASAKSNCQQFVKIKDILTIEELDEVNFRLKKRISDFNSRYSLDGWDYAIAVSCGLFAAMLDLLCVKAPPKPTVSWSKDVDGVFNQWVQKSFNTILPQDVSSKLSKMYPIGAPDSSVMTDLLGAPNKVLNPINHRLRSLSHDPILGFLFGVWDMLHGTCTVVTNGEIKSFPSTKGQTDGNIFQLLGRMLGHLLSDVNAPSAHGNRGMGLPAPFMGILRMFEGIPVGDSNFGKQIEWMYVNGYDFRQFVVSSIPMAIMEVLIRVFYTVKQMKLNDATFSETLVDTMPMKINPRFRMMLAISYGTSCAVNAGKVYITQNILNANYAAWMGFAWNGFCSLKWALIDKHVKLWDEIETKEIEEINAIVMDLDNLSLRASRLPS